MRLTRYVTAALFSYLVVGVPATSQSPFPSPDFVLHDAKHKEGKSGVHIEGNSIAIVSGVGTPDEINALAFSQDGQMLVAGESFGRVIVWDLNSRNLVRAFDTGQRIVGAVAISPDKQTIVTSGSDDNPTIKLWSLSTGKLIKQFDVQHPRVQSLEYIRPETLLVRENGSAVVLNTESGDSLLDLTGERLPLLSGDRSQMVTVRDGRFMFRRTADWLITFTVLAPAENAWPLAFDVQRSLLIYGTFFKSSGFHAVKLSGETLTPLSPAIQLPSFNPSAGYFVSIDRGTGVVFLHANAKAWAWNPNTAKVCNSPILYSESGQLSTDGRFLAAGLDNGIFSKDHVKPGVEVWSVNRLLTACALQ